MSSVVAKSHLESLPPEVVVQILKHVDNPSVMAAVSSRFEQIIRHPYFNQDHFNALFGRVRITPVIYSHSPTLLALNLQKEIYHKLCDELRILQLTPDSIGLKKTDLSSYQIAEHIIEAKNLCLFCQHIPGFTQRDADLTDPGKIIEEAGLCYQELNDPAADFTHVLSLDLKNTRITRLPPETLAHFLNLVTLIYPESEQFIARERRASFAGNAISIMLLAFIAYISSGDSFGEENSIYTNGIVIIASLYFSDALGDYVRATVMNWV